MSFQWFTKTYSYEMRGRSPLDGRIYQVVRGRQCSRADAVQPNPQTEPQQRVRYILKLGVAIWKTFSDIKKKKYNDEAVELNMSGYNLYLSEYLKLYV